MMERAAVAAVVVAGLVSFAVATDGFRAVTTEGARRLDVEHAPRPLPAASLRDHRGFAFSWDDYAGSPVLVEFIFTTCPDVCQKMSSDLGELVRTEQARGSDLRFVSVSFDPANDTVAQLARVARHFGADGARWRFARIDDAAELETTLATFGIVAVPSPSRGFEHNAAIHGIDRKGRLARISDLEASAAIAAWARSL
ncbi:MAG: SCO family protein [Myxococcota bacterium]